MCVDPAAQNENCSPFLYIKITLVAVKKKEWQTIMQTSTWKKFEKKIMWTYCKYFCLEMFVGSFSSNGFRGHFVIIILNRVRRNTILQSIRCFRRLILNHIFRYYVKKNINTHIKRSIETINEEFWLCYKCQKKLWHSI